MIDITGSRYVSRILHPRPVAILISISMDNKVNGCTVAWFTPVNINPFIFAVSLAYRRLTYKYIKESGLATLNIIPLSMHKEAQYIGSVSGFDVPDKFSRVGIKLEYSQDFKVPHIKGALAYIEALLKDELKYEDHALLTFQATKVYVDERFFKDNVFSEEANVLLHVGGNIYTYGYRYIRV